MQSSNTNCPIGKDINEHFQVQLTQLNIHPQSQEDQKQLMQILNFYLNYPDDELAIQHRNANKLGVLDLTSDERAKMVDSIDVSDEFKFNIRQTKILKVRSNACKCCGFIVQEASINVCQSQLKNVINLGTATNIFFKTFYNLALLLLVMTVVYSVFAFATNISIAKSSNYLNSNNSTLDYLSISLGSKSKHGTAKNQDGQMYYYISSWLGVLTMIFWWFMFACFKREIADIDNDYDRILGVADFSIVIEDMPIDFTRQEIQKQFNLYLQELKEQNNGITLKQIKVVKYNQGKPFYFNQNQFADEELVQILESYNETKEKIANYLEEYMQNQKFLTNVADRKTTYDKLQSLSHRKQKKYEQIVKKIKNKMNSTQEVASKATTVVFVTFLTHEMRQFVLDHNKNTIFHKLIRILQCWKKTNYFSITKDNHIYNKITVLEPPQPEDINWGNLGVSFTQMFLRKSFTYFVTSVMIGISLAIVYGFSSLQNANKNTREISLIISLAVSITNLLIIKVIQIMTVIEKDYTTSNFQMSVAIKSVIAQLVNSIFVPVMTNYFIQDQNIFQEGGLVQDIFILGITNSLIPPLVRLIDPYNIFLILRYKYYHNESRKLRMNQFQLNEVSQKMQFQIGMEYIYPISNFLFICFFVSLQPIITLFGIIGLILMYWIQKYALFIRCQRPVPGPDIITSTMYQLIFFGPLCFTLGNLTWSYFLPDESFRGSLVQNFISLGLSVIMLIFPYELCTPTLQNIQSKTYLQKRIYFPSEYDRMNPSTSKNAIEQYRIFLSEKKRELQMSANDQQSEQILRQLANVTQRNMYKGNIVNKMFQKNQNSIVEQIFRNESRNAVNPLLLLTALNHKSLDYKEPQKQNHNLCKSENVGPKEQFSFPMAELFQPTSKRLMEEQNQEVAPKQQQGLFNLYGSNINILDILNFNQDKSAKQMEPKKDVNNKPF